DGRTFDLIRSFQVYGSTFTLGVNLTVGDVLGTTAPELLVAPEAGGAPFVNIFDPTNGSFLKQVQVYGDAYTGGVRLATGNTDGVGKREILVAPEVGGAPFVNIFNAATASLVGQ